MKNQQVIIPILALSTVLLGLTYYLNMMLIPSLKESQVTLTETEYLLDSSNKELDDLKTLSQDFDQIVENANISLNALPSQSDNIGLLYKLQSIADEEDIQNPTIVVNGGEPIRTPGSTTYISTFSISFTGEWNQLISLLSKLQSSLRLVSVDNISIGGSSSLEVEETTLLTINISGSAYYTD